MKIVFFAASELGYNCCEAIIKNQIVLKSTYNE
jgi:hypothetical protein